MNMSESTPLMKLTASQIESFDEFAADKRSIELTLRIAMNFHSNKVNEIEKAERKLWDELTKLYDLDIEKYIYAIDREAGFVVVKRKTDGYRARLLRERHSVESKVKHPLDEEDDD